MGLMEDIGVIWQPVWLAQIGTVLKQNGIDVTIFDFRIQENFPKVLRTNFDYVGLSVHTSDIDSALRTATYVRKVSPGAKIVFGGPHPTALPKQMIAHECVDHVIVGDAEQSFVDLVKGKIKSKIINGSKAADIIPDYSLLQMDKYGKGTLTSESYPSFGIFTSRGCPYHCTFCSTRSYRRMDMNLVFDHIDLLVRRYNMKDCKILDGSFTVNRERTLRFCRRINQYHITWNCQARIDDLDPELLREMAKSGCTSIGVGIESGNRKMRDMIGKSRDMEQVRRIIRAMENVGIESRVCFMFGFLEDTPKTMQQTIEAAKYINADYTHFSIITPFPGTEFYANLNKKNIPMLNDFSKYDTYQLVFKHPVLSEKQIKNTIRQAYRELYINPNYIMKRLRKLIRNPVHESKVLWDGLKGLMSII